MKILMVCLGNICRSPLAEGIMANKVDGMDVEVDSAGIKIARKYDINISNLRGRQFVEEDFDRFDKIYVMDESNYNNVVRLARNDDDIAKVDYILNETDPGENYEVPDPYYGGDAGFENVYQMLDEATNQILNKLKNGESL
jgi:protein-tyrosine phosphatase